MRILRSGLATLPAMAMFLTTGLATTAASAAENEPIVLTAAQLDGVTSGAGFAPMGGFMHRGWTPAPNSFQPRFGSGPHAPFPQQPPVVTADAESVANAIGDNTHTDTSTDTDVYSNSFFGFGSAQASGIAIGEVDAVSQSFAALSSDDGNGVIAVEGGAVAVGNVAVTRVSGHVRDTPFGDVAVLTSVARACCGPDAAAATYAAGYAEAGNVRIREFTRTLFNGVTISRSTVIVTGF